MTSIMPLRTASDGRHGLMIGEIGCASKIIMACGSVKLFVFANKIQGHEMPRDTAQTWRNKA
jgi:hypothetical protein